MPLLTGARLGDLGPVGTAYTRSGIVVATDGSLKKSGAMGVAYVAKDTADGVVPLDLALCSVLTAQAILWKF